MSDIETTLKDNSRNADTILVSSREGSECDVHTRAREGAVLESIKSENDFNISRFLRTYEKKATQKARKYGSSVKFTELIIQRCLQDSRKQ